MTIGNQREQIWESLNDPEYRGQFVEEGINVGIAFQIRSLRNKQNLTQANLAEKIKVRQPLVSAWENPDYGRFTLGTLKELAKAFDVGLLVKFVPFSTLVNLLVDLKPESIAPPNFDQEQQIKILFDNLNKLFDANQAVYQPLGINANSGLQANKQESGRESVHA
jgi:transcriptional regulator with XRE-family HTH domain